MKVVDQQKLIEMHDRSILHLKATVKAIVRDLKRRHPDDDDIVEDVQDRT
jgi:hypothetical protein